MNILKHFLLFFPVLLYAQSPDPLLDLENPQGQQQWVDSLYNQMTLKEKVGQLFMPMVFTEKDSTHYNNTLNLVREHKLGGLVFSLGGPIEQSHWLNSFQAASKTPLLIAMDAEWGGSDAFGFCTSFSLAHDFGGG